MSHILFLDTSGWLAALVTREPRHAEARALYEDTLRGGGRFVTTSFIAAEMHVLVVRGRGPSAGLAFLERLAADVAHEVVHPDRTILAAAVDRWLRPFRDHPISLTDAVGFEVMRERRLTRALALDRHFELAGFETLATG
jgi:predicted nucleic acid-binding protein